MLSLSSTSTYLLFAFLKIVMFKKISSYFWFATPWLPSKYYEIKWHFLFVRVLINDFFWEVFPFQYLFCEFEIVNKKFIPLILESTDQAIRFCANVNVIMKHGYYVESEQMNTHTFLIASYYSHNYFLQLML